MIEAGKKNFLPANWQITVAAFLVCLRPLKEYLYFLFLSFLRESCHIHESRFLSGERYHEELNGVTRISDFQIKDIVNIADGKKLGNMTDLEINTGTGKIEAIIVSNSTRLMGFFGREQDIVIPWQKIKKIGADVILVEHQTVFQTELKDERL
ncbi:YlmC/YmxH family sporulation protein [Peribacillus sp. NPDC097675]|uniref:YlmC/YmxH family sporulation protein n=1 Tax=Peribacillus sp. NPDC097675 TaxID=3390618 RepID=UPI003D027BF7